MPLRTYETFHFHWGKNALGMPFWLDIIYYIIFLHSVLVMSLFPYPYIRFEKQSVSVFFPNRRFQKNSFNIPYPYIAFSNTSEFLPYSVPSFQFSPVPVIFPYPYPWIRLRKKYGSVLAVRGKVESEILIHIRIK